jgi:hypothetical protein
MSVISTVITLIERLPAAAIVELVRIVEGALASDDATRYLAREAQATAAHAAAQAAAREALSRKAKRKR